MEVSGNMIRDVLSKVIPTIYIATGISLIFVCWIGWRKRDKLLLVTGISGIICCISALISHFK